MQKDVKIGIIGGSGLYNMSGLSDVSTEYVSTPFGEPSGAVVIGTLAGKRVAFLPRHGEGHVKNPSEVNYRANIYALKSLGVRFIIGISACGSLREDYAPGDIVVPDQLFDFTKGKREMSFFDRGIVVHIASDQPFCRELSKTLREAASFDKKSVHDGGTFVTIEGPRFSTKGESTLFRQWGLDIIGMTTSPEAYLAREAEISYAVMAHVTDYDVWHEEPVSTEMVIETFTKNIEHAQKSIERAVERIDEEAEYPAHSALGGALISKPEKIDPTTRARVELLIGRYL